MPCAPSHHQLATLVPSVTSDEAALVRRLLDDAGVTIAYITDPTTARKAVGDIRASQPEAIGVDFETEVLPAFRQPTRVAFNKDGSPAASQPRDGTAGAALDPYRSKVRLVQAWAGGRHCCIFDMRTMAWADIAPLFELPLAIFNAVFEVKRLIKEAGITPTGRIFDVMTAHWLTDGRRPSLGEAIAINYRIIIPKTLGASDWSADMLTPEQLEYAALDAVLCRLLWLTQQTQLFDDVDKQCQQLADATVLAVARMELYGMPIDIDTHRKQIAKWKTDVVAAEIALCAASPFRDIQRPAELQVHLREVLTDEAIAAWPRTSTGRLNTRRRQLQFNADLPGIDELLKVRALRKLIEAFGDNLINAVNPVTGRLHTSFMIAGASTGRFSARGPNLQRMPKSKQKGFRKIFVAPAGQLMMALDYSQIELRAVAEIISDWAGEDSILRQSFVAGLDAHTATAMAMTGKNRPEDIAPEERQMAKPCNFGLLYRMGDRGFYNYLRAGYQPDITYAEACDMRARFFEGYPDLAAWQDDYSRRDFYGDKLIGFNGAYAINHPVQFKCRSDDDRVDPP
jgi:DNA polymerase I-like protein with 3'-5' exonuclease and polymerase domains